VPPIPLRYAASREAPIDDFNAIFELYRDGAKAKDKIGRPPLHFAKTADIARLLIEAYSDGL
jgi:hypothetical protein